ncbi:hypothetical protein ACLB2K_016929 [Fragaria x ananassa]
MLQVLKNESDFVRLVCLYFCVTLFFCNSGNDLSWFIVPYIEDLESMSLYAWAPTVNNYLDTSLRARGEMKSTFLKWNLLELYARMKVVDMHELKSPSPVEIPNKEKYGIETTGSEEEGSEEKCEEDIDTSKMFQLLPSQEYLDDIEPGPSRSDVMDKRLDELAALLKNEQARNEILCNENKRLESEIEMLCRSKNLVEVEKQTLRTLRSRSECKKSSFLVDNITDIFARTRRLCRSTVEHKHTHKDNIYISLPCHRRAWLCPLKIPLFGPIDLWVLQEFSEMKWLPFPGRERAPLYIWEAFIL